MKLTKSIQFILPVFAFLLFTFTLHSQQWRVFTTSNSPLPSNVTASITIDSNNVKWIATGGGLVRIENNNWQIFDTTNTPFNINNIYPKDVDNLNNLWLTVPSNGIAKFDGINWIVYDTTNSELPNNSPTSISVDHNNIKWITSPGLIKFDDINWTIYKTTNSGIPTNAVKCVAFENHFKWLGTSTLTGGLVKFNDTSWIVYNTGNSGLPSNTIEDIKIDAWKNKWICTYAGGVAKFNSEQNLWSVYNTSNSGLPQNYPLCITFKNQYIKFIGTTDAGFTIFNDTTWLVFNTNNSPLLNNTILDIEIDKYGNAWISTLNGLVVYNSLAILGINPQNNTNVINFSLSQNYPNPFNPYTIIEFGLTKKEYITLSVYNIEGSLIQQLVNAQFNAGNHFVNFDGTTLASGIYFYSLTTSTSTITKKMILLK